jgi:hypothetical protein
MIKEQTIRACEFCHREYTQQEAIACNDLCSKCAEGRKEIEYKNQVDGITNEYATWLAANQAPVVNDVPDPPTDIELDYINIISEANNRRLLVSWKVNQRVEGFKLYYTTNGSDPTKDSSSLPTKVPFVVAPVVQYDMPIKVAVTAYNSLGESELSEIRTIVVPTPVLVQEDLILDYTYDDVNLQVNFFWNEVEQPIVQTLVYKNDQEYLDLTTNGFQEQLENDTVYTDHYYIFSLLEDGGWRKSNTITLSLSTPPIVIP